MSVKKMLIELHGDISNAEASRADLRSNQYDFKEACQKLAEENEYLRLSLEDVRIDIEHKFQLMMTELKKVNQDQEQAELQRQEQMQRQDKLMDIISELVKRR